MDIFEQFLADRQISLNSAELKEISRQEKDERGDQPGEMRGRRPSIRTYKLFEQEMESVRQNGCDHEGNEHDQKA